MFALARLTSLKLAFTAIRELPSGISRLAGLADLDLSSCYDLELLPEAVSGLVGLTRLNLTACHKLAALPEGMTVLSRLKEVWVRGCSSLAPVPEGLPVVTKFASVSLHSHKKSHLLTKKVGEHLGKYVYKNLEGQFASLVHVATKWVSARQALLLIQPTMSTAVKGIHVCLQRTLEFLL